MFSYGFGGFWILYSFICGELVSFGFVVVVLEYCDGSGVRMFVNKVGFDLDFDS